MFSEVMKYQSAEPHCASSQTQQSKMTPSVSSENSRNIFRVVCVRVPMNELREGVIHAFMRVMWRDRSCGGRRLISCPLCWHGLVDRVMECDQACGAVVI